jgi:hypothetical protein
MKQEEILLDVKRAFVIAKALNYQYVHIREHLSPELRKAVNEAKSRNSYFIKLIEESFLKRKVDKTFLDGEDELSFQILEKLEEIKNTITNVDQQSLSPRKTIT